MDEFAEVSCGGAKQKRKRKISTKGKKIYTAKNGAKYVKLSNGQCRFVKGPPNAKAYMAKIRKRRGKSTKRKTGLAIKRCTTKRCTKCKTKCKSKTCKRTCARKPRK